MSALMWTILRFLLIIFKNTTAAGMTQQKLITELLKQSKDKHGASLFDHLSLMLFQMPLASKEQQINNMEQFELLSDFVKKHRFTQKELHSQHKITEMVLADRRSQYQWVANAQNLAKQVKKVSNQDKILLSNFTTDARLLQWAGVGFSHTVSEHIHQSVKRLAVNVQAKRMRFWGKIMTRQQDYFIAQGISTKQNNSQMQPGMEKQGEGANYYTFWATHNYLEQWHELPLITPEHIRASKQIKYLMTGDLEAPLKAYPTFSGLQKHFLKAQLVRISHTCEIAPKGLYAATEQNPDEVDFTEEFKFPDLTELASLENWVHLNPYILQQGRGSYYIDPSLPEEQKEQIATELNQKDPRVERLKGINEDKPPEGSESNWIVKTQGDTQIFNNIGKEEGTTTCYAVCSIRSLSWPGWLTVATNKQYTSIYVGYGIKTQQQLYFPIGPSDLNEEGEDIIEFPEPNPKDPPDEIEPDSDEEAKKQES